MTKINGRKNAPPLRAILMAMRMRRYNAERIAQYGRDCHEDQAIQTGFDPVWYSILQDYTKTIILFFIFLAVL
jgi:hypothetical protein